MKSPILTLILTSPEIQPKFERFADLDSQHQGFFSTGSFDHFCLAIDTQDYNHFIEKIGKKEIV